MDKKVTHKLRVQLVTWNVNETPMDHETLSKLIDVRPNIDLYVTCFQELLTGVAGTAMSYVSYDVSTLKMLQLFAENKYFLVESIRLQGIAMTIFAHYRHIPYITFVKVDYRRTGLAGYWGNKGGVSISCNIYNRKICFLNVHLYPHMQFYNARVQNFEDITTNLSYGGYSSFLSHDIAFVVGDVNFRIEKVPLGEMKQLISIKNYDKLLEHDQLLRAFKEQKLLSEFVEQKIRFPPTYKFDKGTDDYDTSKKLRYPAWTDRIFYRINPEVKYHTSDDKRRSSISDETEIVQYVANSYQSRMEFRQSDHKPVQAVFDIIVTQLRKPLVELAVKDPWKVGTMWEVFVAYDEDYVSEGDDYVVLYDTFFSDCRTYKTWIYLPPHTRKHPKMESYEFPAISVDKTSSYRIGYFSSRINSLIALSQSFAIEIKK